MTDVLFNCVLQTMNLLNIDTISVIACFLTDTDKVSFGQVNRLTRKATYFYMDDKQIFMEVRKKRINRFTVFQLDEKVTPYNHPKMYTLHKLTNPPLVDEESCKFNSKM